MKLLSFCLLFVTSVTLAQNADSVKVKDSTVKTKDSSVVTPKEVQKETANPDAYKAQIGKFTTELNVNLFQGNLSFNNALQQIKVRYFQTNGLAYRFAFNFSSSTSNTGSSSPYGPYSYSENDKRSTTTLGFGFGLEKHFTGTGRLSPYLGGEFSFVDKFTSEKITSTNSGVASETDIDGAWTTQTFVNGYPVQGYTENAYLRYGLNLVAGFDYYIARKFYVGYEFTFQLYHTENKDINVTYKPTPTYPNNNPTYTTNQTFIGPNIINGIRMGFVF